MNTELRTLTDSEIDFVSGAKGMPGVNVDVHTGNIVAGNFIIGSPGTTISGGNTVAFNGGMIGGTYGVNFSPVHLF